MPRGLLQVKGAEEAIQRPLDRHDGEPSRGKGAPLGRVCGPARKMGQQYIARGLPLAWKAEEEDVRLAGHPKKPTSLRV